MSKHRKNSLYHLYRQKASQNICEVEIKEESCSDDMPVENEQTDADDYDNDDGATSAKRPYSIVNSLAQAHATFLSKQHSLNNLTTNGSSATDDVPSLSINNVAATLDTLKMIKSGQFSQNCSSTKLNAHTYQNGAGTNADIDETAKHLLDMHNKEHSVRMEILQTQLETAKYNRDLAEINKMIAIRNLSALGIGLNGDNN